MIHFQLRFGEGALYGKVFFPASSIFRLASMFQILFSASIKNTWLASIFCFRHVLAKDYCDRPASTFCLASMFQILFRANIKNTWLASIFCFRHVLAKVYFGLPVQYIVTCLAHGTSFSWCVPCCCHDECCQGGTSRKTCTVCQYKSLYIVLATQNKPLPVHDENRIYWPTMCFLYWHGTIFESYWQDRICWQDRFEHPIVNLCQYMTKTEYTGKPCVNHTGTE